MEPKYVRDLMTTNVHTLTPEDDLMTFFNVIHEHDFRHAPVVDEQGDLVGLVSERDLLRNVLTDQADVPLSVRDQTMRARRVSNIMVQDVETVGPEDRIQDAAQIMFDNKFGCVPVTEGNRLVGILTEADFVRYFTERE